MARGGRRQGRAGANYSNRSDMQTGPRLPVQAPPSQAYGERVASENAQRAVPLRAVPSPTAAGAPPTLTAGPPPPPPVALDAPTQRPGEPLTAGSAFGSGPGPDAIGMGPERLSDLLGRLGATGDLADMAVFARQRGL